MTVIPLTRSANDLQGTGASFKESKHFAWHTAKLSLLTLQFGNIALISLDIGAFIYMFPYFVVPWSHF